MQAKHQVAERYIRCPSFFLKNLPKGNALEVRIQVKLRILEFCAFLASRKNIMYGNNLFNRNFIYFSVSICGRYLWRTFLVRFIFYYSDVIICFDRFFHVKYFFLYLVKRWLHNSYEINGSFIVVASYTVDGKHEILWSHSKIEANRVTRCFRFFVLKKRLQIVTVPSTFDLLVVI